MTTTLNAAGESYARSLISSGSVDTSAPWSFSGDDGNVLLGPKGSDWSNYGKHHLGTDGLAPDIKAHWKYPFAKNGKLYRSALIAIRQRAGQQGDTDILDAAGRLLAEIDGTKAQTLAPEFKIAAFEFKFLSSGPDGSFEGYGSTFGELDDSRDMMLPGAFDKTLAQHKAAGTMPKMLLNHGGMAWGAPTPEDMLPIGKWNALAPDSKGLQTAGRLINLDTESGKRIYGAMKEGELSGLSMGYKAKDFTRGIKPSDPRRTIRAVDLHEISPVTFPMDPRATISGVKSATGMTIREFETFLRDAGGFSHAAARAIAADGFKANPDPRDEDGNGDELAALLTRAAALIKPKH